MVLCVLGLSFRAMIRKRRVTSVPIHIMKSSKKHSLTHIFVSKTLTEESERKNCLVMVIIPGVWNAMIPHETQKDEATL